MEIEREELSAFWLKKRQKMQVKSDKSSERDFMAYTL
jgi:hypothetical protein